MRNLTLVSIKVVFAAVAVFAVRGSADAGCSQNVCWDKGGCNCLETAGPWKQVSCNDAGLVNGRCCNTQRRQEACKSGVVKQRYRSVTGAVNTTCNSYPVGSPLTCECGPI